MSVATVRQRVDGEDIEYLHRPGGDRLAVLLHGGHMRADLSIGHEAFLAAGWSVLQPSRPGYGGTPLRAGTDLALFADRIAALSTRLGYREVAVGVSAGGRSAITLAARHPSLVVGLILESATSFLPWPSPSTRAIARVVFRPGFEQVTWALTRLLFRIFPSFTLKRMLSSLSTMRPTAAYDLLGTAERSALADLLSRMRSGSGFMNDLRVVDDVSPEVMQPALVVASRNDGAVPIEHAHALVHSIPSARLVLTDTLSHFLWIGPHAEDEVRAVSSFLAHLSPPETEG
ncbi:alpha/beta hydrolase [Microbacterium shaanxiense]